MEQNRSMETTDKNRNTGHGQSDALNDQDHHHQSETENDCQTEYHQSETEIELQREYPQSETEREQHQQQSDQDDEPDEEQHHQHPRRGKSNTSKTFLLFKLVFTGIFLPAFDMGTDLMAVYHYYTSSQWVFHYFSYGLTVSLLCHNFASCWYARRNWAHYHDNKDSTKFGLRSTWMWKLSRLLTFGLGIGHIQITFELIMELLASNDLDQR